ncbi:MAG TPA: hypothetical protein VM120_00935 [Bryobacteraceae bacterium]|nr:hypothetical protein [Bryobacteraceae bacterium]
MSQAFKSTDLAPDERIALERLVGRPLQNDEAVQLVIHKLDELPYGPEAPRRRQAAAGILELAKGKTLHGATVRELIDEGRRF